MSYPPQVLLLYCSDYTIARFGNSRKEFPPLGLLYLAAACEQANIHVQLLDIASTSDSDLPFYDIIGLSINSSYVYPSFKKKSPIIRSRCKYMLVGGQHTTLFPKQTLEDLNADFALIGEGEISLPKLILALYNKAPIEINGVYKRSSSLKYICKEPQRIENLDALPFPSRHLLPREDILLQNRIPYHDVYSTTIITSRGCPYNCNFCGNIYKKFYHRSGENVLKEIQFIQSQYPEIKGIVFMDENLLFSLDHSKDIISVMSHFNLKWTCNARADGFTQEILPFLRNSGCVEIKYGIESGCQKILTAMNKGITIQTIEQTLKQTSNAGINTKLRYSKWRSYQYKIIKWRK